MKLYGLIGHPLTHSFSESYFQNKFSREQISDCEYRNFPIEQVDHVKMIIRENPDLAGLNVTIPYKETIIPHLDALDDISEKIGAVNTIKITRKKDKILLKGYNTDVNGFSESLKPMLKKYHKGALILGTGGASKAVAYVFHTLGMDYLYVSRNAPREHCIGYYELCSPVMLNYQVIINTTPVGMYPNTENKPDIPYDLVTDEHILYDLIYNPEETSFLSLGKTKGATCMNGLKMLHSQAEKSWEIWNSEFF